MNAVTRLAAAPHWAHADPPRIRPGGLRHLGPRTWLAMHALAPLFGTRGIRLADLTGRDRAVFHAYLPFGRAVITSGLGRAVTELVTLRTAWNTGAWYEFRHHVFLSRLGGLSIETVERIAAGPDTPGLSPAQRVLLRAVDELHEARAISPATLAELRTFLDERRVAELCLLVGHYEMLAMFLKSAGAVPEAGAWERGPLSWLRRPDDSDRLAPASLPDLNRRYVNRIQSRWAPFLPPWAIIVHRGRKSGRVYRTPVMAFRHGRHLIVALPYGDRVDWVRNLLAAGRGGVERLGRLRRISGARVTDVPTAGDLVPARYRPFLRLTKILVVEVEP
ncbi:nitroreductase family deazaflavin-dependent oxidoreductase [Actinocorallia sp. API 0066]|uniref:nitroreductase family deazaflavin-dependent oxidoreductase n=1 Tax=Actinocorallia sp. API 0066 TaxID=2896846 RepID=UPI001E3F8057|nr:nitroreductase family deazaflavin-dependent oxidoreductase [Actinocorallia sp. API 0066]MCD0451434.1 nitroreductase family deazaflavin-dependent oxidoreductase [Actinocorallia sp. API 0066]